MLNIIDLGTRRLGDDLIQMFKIMNGYEVVIICGQLTSSNKTHNLRRHSMWTVRENIRNCSQRFYFYQIEL